MHTSSPSASPPVRRLSGVIGWVRLWLWIVTLPLAGCTVAQQDAPEVLPRLDLPGDCAACVTRMSAVPGHGMAGSK